jgi:hypothetical protein
MSIRKIILGLIILLVVIIFPLAIIPLLIFIIFYIYFKRGKRKKGKNVKKYNINDIIYSIFMKKYNKIVLNDKVNIYKLNDYIFLINKNIKWSILALIQINLLDNQRNLFSNFNSSLDNLIFIKLSSQNSIYIIIKEDFISFKLTQHILKNKINILLAKIDYIYNYFSNLGIKVELVKSNRGDLILI